MIRLAAAAALSAVLGAMAFAGTVAPPAVRIESGLLQGVQATDAAVTVYRGIPYAAPPTGEWRWREPRAPQPWEGTKRADAFGPNCIQLVVQERKPWTEEFMTHGEISEECLSLNVWTAAKSGSERRPVFVWFHGGGLNEGSGRVAVYDGEKLARKGLVVVTVNYRLGIFGYFAHPGLTAETEHHASGNYGYLDQIAALRWVQRNIAAFGGDPSRVTIAGQSAGAGSVHVLTASPLGAGLFQRAIAESGSGVGRRARPRAEVENEGERFAKVRGAPSLPALRAMTPGELLAPLPSDVPAFTWGASVDGWVLTDQIDNVFARGAQQDVPTLTGLNADEGSSAPTYGRLSPDEFASQVRARFGALADRFLELYPIDSPSRAAAAQIASARDQGLVSMYVWADHRAATARTSAFTYYWTHAEPGPDRDLYRAFHTSEVPYVFDSLWRANRPWTGDDRRIAETMSSYWVNFAATGNPNGAGVVAWPAFERGKPVTMELGDRFGTRPVASADVIEFFTRFFVPGRRDVQLEPTGVRSPSKTAGP